MSYLSSGFNSMGCWIVKPVSLKSISYLSSGFQVHGVSTVKPISLKSISYLFGFQLWNQLHWNQFHIYLNRRPRKRMHVCVFVCLRARVRVCVCVSVYVGGKGCFMGRGSYLLHIPHIICIYIHIHVCIYIYIHVYTPFTPLLSGCQVKKRWRVMGRRISKVNLMKININYFSMLRTFRLTPLFL